MAISADTYIQFLKHDGLSPLDCYSLAGAAVLWPMVETYLHDQNLLKGVYEETVKALTPATLKAVRDTASTITVKSGQMLTEVCSPIIERLNRSFFTIAKRVQCAVQPVLCSTLSKVANIIPLTKWTITMQKAPKISY
jgi:hypothetical protein